MATLINCNLCNKLISSDADTCGNCDHPHQKDRLQSKNNKQFLWIMALMIVAAILAKTGLLKIMVNFLLEQLKN